MPLLTRYERLVIATGKGLPLPEATEFTPTDRGLLLGSALRTPTGAPQGVVLDIITPLVPLALDVRGNSQHWAIRTMDAALDHTRDNWLAMFPSFDDWLERCVGLARTNYDGFLSRTVYSKRDLSPTTMRSKYFVKLRDSYNKAQAKWILAFDNEGAEFYQKMLSNSEFYDDELKDFLTFVGLKMVGYVGAVGLHLKAICENQDILTLENIHSYVNVITFPAPPIIPPPYRQDFDRQLLKVLNQKGYLLLKRYTQAPPNAALDTVLAGHLGFDYAAPPTSYIHMEVIDGTWSLHTHIEGAPTQTPPWASDFHVPFPVLTPLVEAQVVQSDLWAHVRPGTQPVASGFIRLDTIAGDISLITLRIIRSDLPDVPVILSSVPEQVVSLPLLPFGVVWQMLVRGQDFSLPLPEVSCEGRLWFTDVMGNESNHAFWSVSGIGLSAMPWTMPRLLPLNFVGFTTIDRNLLAHATPGHSPIVVAYLTLDLFFANLWPIQIFLQYSNIPTDGMRIDQNLGTIYALPVPAPGITWQMRCFTFGAEQVIKPAYIRGQFWVEDSTGALSPRVDWLGILTTPESPTP